MGVCGVHSVCCVCGVVGVFSGGVLSMGCVVVRMCMVFCKCDVCGVRVVYLVVFCVMCVCVFCVIVCVCGVFC